MFTMAMPFLLIPVVGLGIDATMLYSVKAKLQAAVDGAALAAAQSLSAGLTVAAQASAATLAADQFIRANLVTGATVGGGGYWGAYNLNDSNCSGRPRPPRDSRPAPERRLHITAPAIVL